MAAFRERLEEALRLRDMKASDLARLTGIREGAISQYRKGAYKATQINLEKMARALDVPIPWLMGVSDEIEKPTAGQGDGPKERAHKLIDELPEDKLKEVMSYINFLKSQQGNQEEP